MSHPLKRKFEPDVPAVILCQTEEGSVERYTLELLSIQQQKDEGMIDTLISVEEQTKKTNGRVSLHDAEIALLAKWREQTVLDAATARGASEAARVSRKKYFKWTLAIFTALSYPLVEILWGLLKGIFQHH